MQIQFSFPATLEVDGESTPRNTVTSTPMEISDLRMGDYLPTKLADIGISNGSVQLLGVGEPTVQISFDCHTTPANDAIGELQRDVIAQLTDGIGEDGFECEIGEKELLVVVMLNQLPSVKLLGGEYDTPPPNDIAIAAREGDLDMLRELLASGRGSVDRSLQGYSPLHYAVIYGHMQIALELLDAGANANSIDLNGASPLELCAISNLLDEDESVVVAEKLIGAGADVSHLSATGTSIIEFATLRNKDKLVSLLKGS